MVLVVLDDGDCLPTVSCFSVAADSCHRYPHSADSCLISLRGHIISAVRIVFFLF